MLAKNYFHPHFFISSNQNSYGKHYPFQILRLRLQKVIHVWDNQITIKEDLYNWAEKGNGERVKVFRIKNSNFDLKNLKLKNGAYNDLIISDKIELVIENF